MLKNVINKIFTKIYLKIKVRGKECPEKLISGGGGGPSIRHQRISYSQVSNVKETIAVINTQCQTQLNIQI